MLSPKELLIHAAAVQDHMSHLKIEDIDKAIVCDLVKFAVLSAGRAIGTAAPAAPEKTQ